MAFPAKGVFFLINSLHSLSSIGGCEVVNMFNVKKSLRLCVVMLCGDVAM